MSLNILALTCSQDSTQLSLQSVDDETLHEFATILETAGLFVIKRWAKGRGLQAGCGQLSGNKKSQANAHRQHLPKE
ncbi:MAG: hypothetical protein QM498_13755 [Desulfobacterium sp.]